MGVYASPTTTVDGIDYLLDEDDDEGRGPRILTIRCMPCDTYIDQHPGNGSTDSMVEHAALHVECGNPACDELPLQTATVPRDPYAANPYGPPTLIAFCSEDCFDNHIDAQVVAAELERCGGIW